MTELQNNFDSSTPRHIAAAANSSSFRLKPLTVAIDELQTSTGTDAPGDIEQAANCRVELSDAALVEWVYATILSPADKPNELIAFAGFEFGLEAFSHEFPTVAPLCNALKQIRTSQIYKFVSTTVSPRPLQGRRTAYLEYDLCLAIGVSNERYPQLLGAIAAAELLLAKLKGRRPNRRLLQKCRATSSEALSGDFLYTTEVNWKLKSQVSCLMGLKEELTVYAQKNREAAAVLGIAVADEHMAEHAIDPITDFNKLLNSRWTASANYIPIRDRQGATALQPVVVREIGRHIRDAAEVDDALAVVEYFEIHFNITPALVHRIRLLSDGEIPRALLSLDIDNQLVYVGNNWLLKNGAKPAQGTEHLYLETLSVYPVHIPAFISKFLKRRRAARNGTPATELGQLLDSATHQPKLNLLGDSAPQGVTAHKIRRAACTNLVHSGHSRMTVAATTCQHGYVSPGRGYYSCVSSIMLREATQDFFRSFGWLGSCDLLTDQEFFVGSKVTPKSESIQAAFRIVSLQVDRADVEFKNEPSFENWLQRHYAVSAYIGLTMEVCLCYRNKDAYDYSLSELFAVNSGVHIDDKKVRAMGGGPAVSKPALLIEMSLQYARYISDATSFLVQQANTCDAAARIVNTLGLKMEQEAASYPIVDFDIHGQTVQVGTAHWHQSLPPSFRLVENFARHFWPLAALQAGLNQVHLDYLLRHQLDGAEHETDQDTKSPAKVRQELVGVVDNVLASLCLDRPQFFARESVNA